MGLLDALQGTTTDPSAPASGGLLDSFMNWAKSSKSQPAADGLLAAGLGILANNHGLTSGTQAIGLGGLQGLQQYGQTQQSQLARQMQMAQLQQAAFGLQKNKMLLGMAQNLMGPGGAAPTAAPQAGAPGPSPTLDAGGLPAGASGSGPGVASSPVPGMPMPPGAVQQGSAPQMQPAAAPSRAAGMFGNMPNNLAAFGLITDPGKLFEQAASQYSPTDLQRTMRAAGIDPNSAQGQQILQANIAKTNNIPPVSGRPGGYLTYADGRQEQLPQVPEGYTAQRGQDGQWQMVPVQGGAQAIAATSQAKASGPASFNLQKVWNPTSGQYEMQPATNVAAAAGGASAPTAGLAANNPGNMMPGGKLAQYATPEAGLAAIDGNLAHYGQQGVNTLAGVISKWAPPNENNTAAYIADASQRLGLKPNQPIDLSNPIQRHAIASAIVLHENGPSAIFGVGRQSAAPQGGPMAAEPAPGMVPNANAAQSAGAHTMKDSYSALQAGRSTAGSALDALQMMQGLAANKNPLVIGPLGTAIAPVSSNAAEYEKQRANVIQLLSKQGGLGTDAARALVGDSVPDYGKPKAAIQEGLQTLINQTKTQQIKANLLTPAYNAGDSKTYTALENGFDQHITPALVPLLEMPAGPQRAAALKSAAMNPQKRTALEWAVQNGVLK